jgi:prepilin-type N-terminal cleavage/methylation domain-containing protein
MTLMRGIVPRICLNFVYKSIQVVKIRKNAFTLIELLVVISIIALLVSILLPAMSQAREQARMAVCSVHVSGIGKAVLIYINDSRDQLPNPGVCRNNKTQTAQSAIGFNNQHCSNPFPYWEYSATWRSMQCDGPAELGCIYLAGLLENDSDIVFCPSFHGYTGNGYAGQRNPLGWGYNAWNARGDPSHWNYYGINSTRNQHMRPEDEAKIGWYNGSVSYGVRFLLDLGIKNISRTRSSMSYLADRWQANTGYWDTHIDEIAHSYQGAAEARLHGWYFDGHVNRISLDKSQYFCSSGTLPDGYMNNGSVTGYPALTWEIIFEDKPYPLN